MLIRTLSASLLAIALMGAAAQAQDIALAKDSMRLFGGLSMDYPRIGLIIWDQGLKVIGCRNEIDWCEVVADGQRGWVPGAKLTWPGTQRKPLDVGSSLHVTI